MSLHPLRPFALALLGFVLPLGSLAAADRPVIDLWPEGVPGLRADAAPDTVSGTSVTAVHRPTLTVYRPAKPNGTAIIICPGGGYNHLSIANEGTLVAERFNTLGVTAFILRYRLNEYGHPAPLRDVLRAVRLVRSQAADYDLNASRIGVLGFSAGGHLAACAGTLYNDPEGRTGAALDAVSARPDFLVLLYPVIALLFDPITHAGSRTALLGPQPAPALLDHLSPDLQVTAGTPPTFLGHTADDGSVPVENSLRFFRALRQAGVPAELHVWPTGKHGFGMHPDVGDPATWPDRCADWMRANRWLPPLPMNPTPSAQLPSTVLDWEKLPVKPTKTGERRELFDSPTATFNNLEGHVTTLNPGETPHAPHRHPDEEMIIIRAGTLEVMINGVTQRVGAGSVFFFASNDLHGLRNVGETQATYFVLRFQTPLTPKH
jgi:acetyl esterase/lipase/quercetin dioxygenase-like cupin family protein